MKDEKRFQYLYYRKMYEIDQLLYQKTMTILLHKLINLSYYHDLYGNRFITVRILLKNMSIVKT
jgi:hypothetical protein